MTARADGGNLSTELGGDLDRSAELATHWDSVYGTKGPSAVSWFQRDPVVSLEMIASAKLGAGGSVLDVGGGTSFLVDRLLDLGYRAGVLDLSAIALAMTKVRLGSRADQVEWFVGDVLTFESPHGWDLWHDRAVFHFLTSSRDRRSYWTVAGQCLAPGGTAVVATFGPNGPERCSGLATVRYRPEELLREAGEGFALVDTAVENHLTPGGVAQEFVYVALRRV